MSQSFSFVSGLILNGQGIRVEIRLAVQSVDCGKVRAKNQRMRHDGGAKNGDRNIKTL